MVIITTDDAQSVDLGDRPPSKLKEFEAAAAVDSKREVADGVAEIYLSRVDGKGWPEWTPGAHVDLLLPNGLIRQYSLCGAELDRAVIRIGVLREPAGRGGSAWIHDVLAVGDEIMVRGPRNAFQLGSHQSYVFVAGGIGITPILSMVRHVSEADLPWELHYGGRTRASMAFVDELAALEGGSLTLYPQDVVGFMPLAEIFASPSTGAGAYVCGPGPLLSAVDQYRDLWPQGTIQVERFAPSAEATDLIDNQPIQLTLASSGIELEVGVGESVLEAVEKRGIAVLSSCRVGTCGTCETPVLEGEPDHRDSVLDDEERASNDCMMICVSRAKSRHLVLDL